MTGRVTKPKWVLLLLAGALVGPYVAFDERVQRGFKAALGKGDAAANSPLATSSLQPSANELSSWNVSPGTVSPKPPLCDMGTALRFEVTPQWVTATWPRVTTVAADGEHSAMRVPLVTGVMPDDLVGTLTYYFDDDQRLVRITFTGNTGDSRRVVELVTRQFGLSAESTLDAGLYRTKWNGTTISTLRIRHASVVSAAASHGKYEVQLDLQRADALAGTAGAPRRLFGF